MSLRGLASRGASAAQERGVEDVDETLQAVRLLLVGGDGVDLHGVLGALGARRGWAARLGLWSAP